MSLRDALARAAVPLAALAAMAALASREVDPVGGAETGYLALLATAGLLAVAFLAPPPAWEAGIGAALATTVVWGLPPGPGRGAALVLVLVSALAMAAARRWAKDLKDQRDRKDRTEAPGFFGSFWSLLPLALGFQILLRGSDLLFQPQMNVRTLVALLALPTAGAIATALLARRHGSLALAAAGTALLLAPGWNVVATLGLVALAAGDALGRPDLGRIAKAVALLVLLAPIAWAPGPGIAAAAAGLVLARPKEGPFIALAAAAGLAVFAFRDVGWAWTAWLPFLLLPASLFPGRDQRWGALAGLALAIAVPRHPDLSALAAPLALLALGGGAARRPAGLWTATLLFATCLLASYPWLRAEPLREALGLFGLAPTLVVALLLVTLFGVLAILARAGLPVAASLVFLVLASRIPAPGQPLLLSGAVVLDPDHPAWTSSLDDRSKGTIVLESSLFNGANLANGMPVATVRLRGRDGRTSAWTLRAGMETGEWAARRPDVMATSVLISPPSWISWVAGDFFGQRYRARLTVDAPGPFTALSVERSPALPAKVSLALHAVEVRK